MESGVSPILDLTFGTLFHKIKDTEQLKQS